MTNKEILEKSVKFANFLQKNGIKIGDRVSIAAENRIDWLVPVCATFYIGAILAPYNPLYTECKTILLYVIFIGSNYLPLNIIHI